MAEKMKVSEYWGFLDTVEEESLREALRLLFQNTSLLEKRLSDAETKIVKLDNRIKTLEA